MDSCEIGMVAEQNILMNHQEDVQRHWIPVLMAVSGHLENRC